MTETFYPVRVFLKEGLPGEWGERSFVNVDLILPSMLYGGMPLGYGIYIQNNGIQKSLVRFQSQYEDILLRKRSMMSPFVETVANQLKDKIIHHNDSLNFDYKPPVKEYLDNEQNTLGLRPLTRAQRKVFEKEILHALAGK